VGALKGKKIYLIIDEAQEIRRREKDRCKSAILRKN